MLGLGFHSQNNNSNTFPYTSQVGYPCPDTMELTPAGNSVTTSATAAECRCPPGTAQSPDTSRCHKLFEQGPCDIGQFFAPVADIPSRNNVM